MSLNAQQRRAVRAEFEENLRRSGLSHAEVEQDLGFSTRRLRSAMKLRLPTTGSDIWLVRDYLEQAVQDSGAQPVRYTVLTEESRSLAQTWFTIPEAPRHAFAPRASSQGS